MPHDAAETQVRPVQWVHSSQPTIEGAGVHLRRAFGHAQVPRFDPFLLLDDFRIDNPADYLPGFPWHPHRGIETVTYMLEGRVDHQDSMGNEGVIGPGDVQWMTAGSGIVHQEMPRPSNGRRLGGLQLWVNLPKHRKMRDPRYQEVPEARVPTIDVGKGVRARVVAGRLGDVQGPVREIEADPEFLDLSLAPYSSFRHAIPRGHTVLAYVLQGRGQFDGPEGEVLESETLLHYGDGDHVHVRTDSKPARFLLISGKPTHEPVAWWGPIVMASQKDLEQALTDLQEGTFIKTRGRAGDLSHVEHPHHKDAPDPKGYAGGAPPEEGEPGA